MKRDTDTHACIDHHLFLLHRFAQHSTNKQAGRQANKGRVEERSRGGEEKKVPGLSD